MEASLCSLKRENIRKKSIYRKKVILSKFRFKNKLEIVTTVTIFMATTKLPQFHSLFQISAALS